MDEFHFCCHHSGKFSNPRFVHVCTWKRTQLASSKSKVFTWQHLSLLATAACQPLHTDSTSNTSLYWVDVCVFACLVVCFKKVPYAHCVFTEMSSFALWEWDFLIPLAWRLRGGGQVWCTGALLPADPRSIGCITVREECAWKLQTGLVLPSSGRHGKQCMLRDVDFSWRVLSKREEKFGWRGWTLL